ncbi:MAG: GNAT family N-acetyltransferase [Alphaproteobacteria bacterium]|nr:GNAT family N-acetyltransferase [Alphaproteobacteria bacterium]
MTVCVETARLKLVPLAARWNDDLFKLFHDPDVADWLFLTGPPTRAQLEERTKVHEQIWRERGYGMFAVLEKPSDRFVARVGAMTTPETGRIEIAWSTIKDAWGRGYAAEAAKASIDFTFAHSKLASLDCYLRPDNTASRRVAEKVGFTYQDTRFLYDRPLRYYKMPRG